MITGCDHCASGTHVQLERPTGMSEHRSWHNVLAAFVHQATQQWLRPTSNTLVSHHLATASMSHIFHKVDPDLELGSPSGAPSTIPTQFPL